MSDAFHVWPETCASMLQKRRMVGAATSMPSCGRSRSRNDRRKSSRHVAAAPSERARNARGNPPRTQSWSIRFAPTSSIVNPASVWWCRRPARLSEDCRSNVGEALPRTRNRAGTGVRSASTRSRGKRSGRRWISSRITSPRSPSRAVSASCNRATSRSRSRSKVVTGPRCRTATSCASVLFPTCRAPRRATTGSSFKAASTRRT